MIILALTVDRAPRVNHISAKTPNNMYVQMYSFMVSLKTSVAMLENNPSGRTSSPALLLASQKFDLLGQ